LSRTLPLSRRVLAVGSSGLLGDWIDDDTIAMRHRCGNHQKLKRFWPLVAQLVRCASRDMAALAGREAMAHVADYEACLAGQHKEELLRLSMEMLDFTGTGWDTLLDYAQLG
jgi:hypothetical protein